MNSETLLKASSLAGKILLESGAETTRVEQTVHYICNNYGVQEINVFATPTGLFISFEYQQKTYSKTCRVTYSNLNLSKINLVNQVSRTMKKDHLTTVEVLMKLENIKQYSGYSKKTIIIASGMVAASFTMFFNFNLLLGLIAFFVGMLVQVVNYKLISKQINPVVRITFLSVMISVIALFLLQIGIINDKDSLIIGCLMLLVPGVAITNAIRDTLLGDLLSGLVRGAEAFLIAIALAAGAGIAIALWQNVLEALIK